MEAQRKDKYGAYAYMQLSSHELRRPTAGGGGPTLTSLPPSVLGTERKPWIVDALPRRFADGLPLPHGVVEGVMARDSPAGAAGAAGSASAPLQQQRPYTAPRKTQRTYNQPQGGGCLCGAVRFAVNAATEPRLVCACHCSLCRKSSGAAFLVWATVNTDDYVLLQGHPAEYVQSGGVRRFCGTCGTPLSFQRTDLGDELDVQVGSLDEPGLWDVEMNIWASQRVPPLQLDNLPSHGSDPATLLKQGQQET